jgi:hypothetical protein
MSGQQTRVTRPTKAPAFESGAGGSQNSELMIDLGELELLVLLVLRRHD